MTSAAALLQAGAGTALDAGYAWIVGTSCARLWLRPRADPGSDARIARGWRRTELPAVGICLAALAGATWAATAVMMGGSLGAAGGMLWTMVTQTAYGHAGLLGFAMLLAIGGVIAPLRRSAVAQVLLAVLLLGFAASRACVSHAAENGLASIGFAVEWIHLSLIAVWLGGVSVGGWLVLPRADAGAYANGAISRYLRRLSHAATLALVGIFATGIYNAFERVGSVDNVMGNPYGTALLVKLAFVGLAVVLGGYNKVIGFPALTASAGAKARVIAVLRVESLLLLGALAAATFLTTQQPPTAG